MKKSFLQKYLIPISIVAMVAFAATKADAFIYNPTSLSGVGTVTSITAGTGLSGGTITTTGTIAVNASQSISTLSNLTSNGLVTTSGGTGALSITATTGSGNVVLATGPTLSSPIVGTQATSDNSTKAASTAYVTTAVANAIAGVNPAVAVTVATTQASDTSGLTYNNGVAGIGATFTGSNNTALTFDGVTLTSLNQRVLVKNDTQSPSGAFNGVYYLTQLQTGILPPILTRALDYDMPSDINSTGAIPVVSGTTNASTSWVITSTVTTVGTDPLTYTNFTLNPTTLATLTGTQTLTNKRITPRIGTEASSATSTPTADTVDQWNVTALAAADTFAAPTGTPTDGQPLTIRIKDNGTARALAWNAIYRASSDLALPSTTIISKTLYMKFIYNAADSKWDFVAYLNNF